MANSSAGSARRDVTVERIANGVFTVTSSRGGLLRFGAGSGTDFTPAELLLAAIGGCTAIDVDILTSRRAEPKRFEVRVDAEKVRDADGSRLTPSSTGSSPRPGTPATVGSANAGPSTSVSWLEAAWRRRHGAADL